MIATITGRLIHKSPAYLIVDAHGVGYQIFTPLSSFYHLPEIKETVMLNTYTHVREDALQLFGFLTMEEKDLFLLLITISGIGPKLALNILSGMPVAELVSAVRQGDVARLCSIPGIGQKIAARLALELKEKIAAIKTAEVETVSGVSEERRQMIEDALSALVNLGYNRAVAKEAVLKISLAHEGELSVGTLLKESLKRLSR
ncbi:MAG TPA: Holliday junction branch migration protein RuvA [Nitrospiria bacterium]|jgi:Holliday junction DNA helicase RuvA|nr:Holliday junction branch migration protein RuvA [Nitrospiria bacterium]